MVVENKIKEYTDRCRVHEYKEELERHRELLFKVEREMARMVLDFEVGTYARTYAMYEECAVDWYDLESVKKATVLRDKLRLLEDNEKVDEYRLLKLKRRRLLSTLGRYYKSINIDFRGSFDKEEVPDIFVFQGDGKKYPKYAFARNIVDPELGIIFKRKSEHTVIYPEYELKSNREFRHFYNHTSFKYLEAMTNDYSFDYENKDLGKVKIKK